MMMGQIQELQAGYAEDTIQRITAESTTLKQRARQLADDNRSLQDKLQAAGSNNRFLDKRIADLEAQLLGTTKSQRLPRRAAGPPVSRLSCLHPEFLNP